MIVVTASVNPLTVGAGIRHFVIAVTLASRDLHRGNGIRRPRDNLPKIAFMPKLALQRLKCSRESPLIAGFLAVSGGSTSAQKSS